MAIPTLAEARQLLAEGGRLNPGRWVQHSEVAAQAAELIAARIPGLDPDKARIFGLLHDIGRRFGVTDMRHVLDGYRFLTERGYEEAGRICLTHSFPIPDARSGSSVWDASAEEVDFVQDYLEHNPLTEYERLLVLCDAVALPSGFCLIEKRMVDVALRYGFNTHTIEKWKAILRIQQDFEAILGQSIYGLLPGVAENTFTARIF